ncbi:MAG: hypothetical protein KDB16_12125 [Acidimicrobiales bacterium]|nr:hypothetical protein [Acidimicrobiales bacterium]
MSNAAYIDLDWDAFKQLARHRDVQAAVLEICDAIADRAADNSTSDRFGRALDTDVGHEGWETIGEVTVDLFWAHIEEFGTATRPPAAPLRRAADQLGLDIE